MEFMITGQMRSYNIFVPLQCVAKTLFNALTIIIFLVNIRVPTTPRWGVGEESLIGDKP
jgi:hypothetical protein